MHPNRKNRIIVYFMVASSILLSCESFLNPIESDGSQYSIYGTFDLQTTPNYIRVYDTKKLLNPVSTRELDLSVLLTNLTSMQSFILEGNRVQFDNIFTHNYQVDFPIEFDTRYRVIIQDGNGFRDSLVTVTTKQTDKTVLAYNVVCSESFFVELTNIDLNAGERLEAEVAVQVGGIWHWTSRTHIYSYNPDTNTLVLGWSPIVASRLIFGESDIVPCSQFTSDTMRFRFTHIGYMEGSEKLNYFDKLDIGDLPGLRKVVLSKYSGEVDIKIEL